MAANAAEIEHELMGYCSEDEIQYCLVWIVKTMGGALKTVAVNLDEHSSQPFCFSDPVINNPTSS